LERRHQDRKRDHGVRSANSRHFLRPVSGCGFSNSESKPSNPGCQTLGLRRSVLAADKVGMNLTSCFPQTTCQGAVRADQRGAWRRRVHHSADRLHHVSRHCPVPPCSALLCVRSVALAAR
jgi:hypothetical protein